MRLKTLSAFGLGIFSGLAIFAFSIALAQQPENIPTSIRTRYSVPLTIQVPRNALVASDSLTLTFTFTVESEQQIVISQIDSLTHSPQITVTGAPKGVGVTAGKVYSLEVFSLARSISGEEHPTTGFRLGTIRQSANLRAGPSTSYAVVGQASAGDVVEIVGASADGSWLRLKGDEWIASSLIGNSPGDAKLSESMPTPYPLTGIEMHYTGEVKRIFATHIPILRDMQNTLRLAEQDTGVLRRKVWLDEISGYALLIRVLDEEIQNLTAPTRLEGAHAKLLEGIALLEDAADIILQERSGAMTIDMYNRVQSSIKAGIDKFGEGLGKLRDLEK